MCAEAKRYLIRQAIRQWITKVTKPKFMTFTVKHTSAPLIDQINRLYKAYRLFRMHKLLKKKQRGGVWFFQLKRSKKSGQWHPHLHVIMDMDYINKVAIQDDWLVTTGDSFVVDIRAIKDPGKVADYVSRYASKPCELSNFSEPDQDEIYNSLHGKRLCGRFGSGSACQFKAERPIDFAKWQRICTWTDCILNRGLEPILQRIIKAWATNQPLGKETADSISVIYAPGQWASLHKEEVAKQEKQFFLEFG